MEDENEADIHRLFALYNSLYFDEALFPCVLKWSSDKALNSRTGICHYDPGGVCELHLSAQISECFSTLDLKGILLHEMIHAFLWIKDKNRNHSDHGLTFQQVIKSINFSSVMDPERPDGGYNIALHHKFKKELKSYRLFYWKCDTCGDWTKKRRKPSTRDCRNKADSDKSCGDLSCHWHNHRNVCTGSYTFAERTANEYKLSSLKDLKHGKELSWMARQTARRLSKAEETEIKPNVEVDMKDEQKIQEDDLLSDMTKQSAGKLCIMQRTEEKADGKKATRSENCSIPVTDVKVTDLSKELHNCSETKADITKTQNSDMAPETLKELNKPSPTMKQSYKNPCTGRNAIVEPAAHEYTVKSSKGKHVHEDERSYMNKAIVAADQCFSPANEAKRNTKGLKNRKESKAAVIKPENKLALKRKKSYASMKRTRYGKLKNAATGANEWFCAYGDEEEDETIEPLKDKRIEGRKKLKLLQLKWKNIAIAMDDTSEEEGYATP